MWALGKKMCDSLQNSVMLLGFDFMPLEKSVNMSLNGLRRRVVTHDKKNPETRMDKPSVALDPGHGVLASGAHPLSFR
jgi:hypothetical protein